MKTILKCPRSGQYSSKRIIALLFALAAVVTAFIPYIDASITITFATLSVGSQATTLQNPKQPVNEQLGREYRMSDER